MRLLPSFCLEFLAELKFLLIGNRWLSEVVDDEWSLSTGLHIEIDKFISQFSLIHEWGTGSSTLLADKYNIPIYSVENHYAFAVKIASKFINRSSVISVRKFGAPTGPFGRPISFIPIMFYCHKQYTIIKPHPNGVEFDLYIIDGRCRLLCLLNILRHVQLIRFSSNPHYCPTIILDDACRAEYTLPSSFFQIRELSETNRAAIFKLTPSDPIDKFINQLVLTINSIPPRKRFL